MFDIYQRSVEETDGKKVDGKKADGKKKSKNTKKKIIQQDTPMQILVSPYAVHGISGRYPNKYYDVVEWFQDITDTKIIIYRTKCPRSILSVIDDIPDEKYSKNYKPLLKNIAINGAHIDPVGWRSSTYTAIDPVNNLSLIHI